MTRSEILQFMRERITRERKISGDELTEDVSFFELGFDSISIIYLLDQLEKFLGKELNPIWFYDYPTLGQFASFLETEMNKNA